MAITLNRNFNLPVNNHLHEINNTSDPYQSAACILHQALLLATKKSLELINGGN